MCVKSAICGKKYHILHNREERNLNQSLREEQDAAYLASLRQDQEKERKKREEKEAREREEQEERERELMEEKRLEVERAFLCYNYNVELKG